MSMAGSYSYFPSDAPESEQCYSPPTGGRQHRSYSTPAPPGGISRNVDVNALFFQAPPPSRSVSRHSSASASSQRHVSVIAIPSPAGQRPQNSRAWSESSNGSDAAESWRWYSKNGNDSRSSSIAHDAVKPHLPPKPISMPSPSLYSPSLLPSSSSMTSSSSFASSPPPQTEDDDALSEALAMSLAEAKRREEELRAQEEAEVTRALRESQAFAPRRESYWPVSNGSSSYAPASTSNAGLSALSPVSASSSSYTPSEYVSNISRAISTNPSQMEEDEAFARKLAEEDAPPDDMPIIPMRMPEPILAPPPLKVRRTSPSPPRIKLSQIQEDEELARKLASEEANTESVRRDSESLPVSSVPTPQQTSSAPPEYAPRLPDKSSPTQPSMLSTSNSLPQPPITSTGSPPSHLLGAGRQSRPSSLHGGSGSSTQVPSPAAGGRSAGISPTITSPSPGSRPTINSTSNRSFNASRTSFLDPLETDEVEESTTDPSPPPLAPSQYAISPELLWGVSMSFSSPNINEERETMPGAIPNIINLHYGQTPPLHIQAPSWHQMLMLMARLSNTRIEPTIEALAASKSDLFLRTVIQFVRIHPSSTDWRTIVWLTLDYPVPPTPNKAKYMNGDVNILPYSYTLSPTPPLLKEGSETTLSKFYSVPATSRNPFPKMPIKFPDLAMYLHSVLDESRRMSNDSSSGIRKLAKSIDSCYPSAPGAQDDDLVGSSGVRSIGGRLRDMVRRGNRHSSARGVNDDTYVYVTPFYADDQEWG